MADPKKPTQPVPPTQDAHIHTSMRERIWEWTQNIGLFLAFFMGMQKNMPTVDKNGETKQIPGWLINMFPSFTREDETEFNLILDSHPDPVAKQIELNFRDNLIADGFDETKYRLGLVHFRREYLERMRSPMPENKSPTLTFQPLAMKDSANEFLTDLLAENVTGRSPEEIYEGQRKIALSRKLLEKNGLLKNVLSWATKNKLETCILLVLSPFILLSIIYWILNLFLG